MQETLPEFPKTDKRIVDELNLMCDSKDKCKYTYDFLCKLMIFKSQLDVLNNELKR